MNLSFSVFLFVLDLYRREQKQCLFRNVHISIVNNVVNDIVVLLVYEVNMKLYWIFIAILAYLGLETCDKLK